MQPILAFGCRRVQEFVSRPLRSVIEETPTLLRSTLPAQVALDAVLSDAPMFVPADATQMQQVLMNLCANAWHALKDGAGRIPHPKWGWRRPTSARCHAHDALRRPEAGPSPLPVGSGRRQRHRSGGACIFDPFYSTEPVGQGTGPGLSVVCGTICAHHGAITVDSASEQGTTFQRPPRRCATRAFDVVVTDFNVPGLTRLDMARTVATMQAELPVVISSGYISEQSHADAAAAGVHSMLNKEALPNNACRW